MRRAFRVAVKASAWILVAAASALTPAGTCLAQSGPSMLNVTLPEVLVLGYYPEIRAVVDAPGHLHAAAHSASLRSDGTGSVGVAVHVDGRFLESLGGAQASAFASGTLASAFAVRGTSPHGRTSLRLEVESTTAAHPAGGVVRATEVVAVLDGRAASTLDFATPGVGRTVIAGLGLTLDLRGARNGGWHEGIRIRVTAESL